MLQNDDLVLNDLEKDHLDLDQCVKGNIYGPRIRRYHLIHFVLDGCGTLTIESHKYPVRTGQAFLIPAGVMASYQADMRIPWKYCWIGFHGTQVLAYCQLLSGDSYVMDVKNLSIYE